MKLRQVAAICKKSGIICMAAGPDGTQWVGDGGAWYPLVGLPKMGESIIKKIFDYTPDEADKIQFEKRELPFRTAAIIDFDDIDEIKPLGFSITAMGHDYAPIATSYGPVFLDYAHLKPITNKTRLAIHEKHVGKNTYVIITEGIAIASICPTLQYIGDHVTDGLRYLGSNIRLNPPAEEIKDLILPMKNFDAETGEIIDSVTEEEDPDAETAGLIQEEKIS